MIGKQHLWRVKFISANRIAGSTVFLLYGTVFYLREAREIESMKLVE